MDEKDVLVSDEELRMSFTEHLGELRDRLIRSAIAVAICAVICYLASDQIFEILAGPIKIMEREIAGVDVLPEPEKAPEGSGETAAPVESPPAEPEVTDPAEIVKSVAEGHPVWLTVNTDDSLLLRLKIVGKTIEDIRVQAKAAQGGLDASWTVLNPMEPLIVTFKIAGYGGLFLAMPYVLYQLCAFIFPGLHPKERKAAQYLIAGCTVLAFAGVCVAYFGVFPFVLPYLAQFVPEDVNVQLRMNETISMIVLGLLGFGIAFQFPMVVLILVYMGVLSPDTLRQYRKIVIVGLAVVSAMLTPPDPVSMTLMLVPLYLLYEGSIWVSYLVIRSQKKAAAKDA
ncbi:MAG: twin-arginine translocase subunit TatC [Candidatus Hydrogenedentes bacterium]|nr:twin-arginine translocase subunit TatC [Candidatus Hydrogenedentota bacterium]